MPKKKTIPADELQQGTGELPGQAETLPQDMGVPESGAPFEGEPGEIPAAGDSTGLLGEGAGNTPEVPGAGVPPISQDDGAELVPPGDAAAEDFPPDGQVNVSVEDTPPIPGSAPADEAVSTSPMADRQSFFALDFRELDRGLTAEERQAWNSIYASYRGRSALSGKIIGADPHSMNVRNRETGQVERRTMYCVVVLLYRVPVYIPATEMNK